MMNAAKKMGRPKKKEAMTFVTINVPAHCKVELDEIRHKIADNLGFGVSYSDAILYLINRHTLSETELKK